MSYHELLRYTGNLFHYLVCCKCIVCPKKSELMQSRTTVPVQPNVPIQRNPYIDYEDGSIYNGSSMYLEPVTSQPTTHTIYNGSSMYLEPVTSQPTTHTSGVTISAKSMTVANNEQFMHAVKVDFTCEVKGMVEVGGVPKEVKGMISIINNDNKSQVVSAVNSNLNQQTDGEYYTEPIDASQNVKITKRSGPLPQTTARGVDEGYGSQQYGSCSFKDDLSENIYDTIAEEKETPQDDTSAPSNANNSSNTKTGIKNELEKILSRQVLNASNVSSEVDGGVGNTLKSRNKYYNTDDDHDHETGNISPCSSWGNDEFDDEPIYGNHDTILRIKNSQSFTATNMNKADVTNAVTNKEYTSPNSRNTTHLPTKKAATVEEYNDENIYEDIVINAAVNQRY